MLAIVIACAAACALAFAGVFAAVCACAAREYPPATADCIVVLGARVWPDGRMSNALTSRCQCALDAWRDGRVGAIVLCGGQIAGEPAAEAAVMREWMLAQGVPEGALYLDETSANTAENLINARAVMAANGFETAAVCTSDYHLPRALWIARDAGVSACGLSAPSSRAFGARVTARLREAGCWVLYFIRRIGR